MELLHSVDILIIALYLVTIVVIGLVLRKRAQRSKDDYLLGGKSIPWYMLGLSNASGMFDISGTIWLVTLMFVYGIKSAWIPWLWPVFNQIFLMIYLSKWLRRSNATTGAEWIGTRFGFGKGAKMSHIIVVVFALVVCLGYLAYGFIGLGKFVEIFVPWEVVSNYIPFAIAPEYVPHFYGTLFTIFAVFYSLLGGMSGIVWADVVQFAIMTVAALVIGYLGFQAIGTSGLHVPEGWMSPFKGGLNMDWSRIIPEVTDKIESDGYGLFTYLILMMLFKGILVSVAGPAPTYDMQKILSTKSPAEAAKMSGFVSVILMPIRYLMIAGFAALALVYYDRLDLLNSTGNIDFELILPTAIKEFVPVGLLGLLLAGLIAAFMSTFAGTLNAAQAYLVNDIYLKYTKPEATASQIKNMNYLTGIVVVIVSIILGFYAENVNAILNIIVSVLYGSYVGANILKWHWWRFNGEGFFWGMVAGLVAAYIVPTFMFPDVNELYLFPILLIVSLIGSIIGTYSAPPTNETVLKEFYKNVRPWGFWKPVYEKLVAEDPNFKKNKDFGMDMFNVVVGIVAQTALVILPMYIIFRQNTPVYIAIAILVVCIYLLKKFWWNNLEKELD